MRYLLLIVCFACVSCAHQNNKQFRVSKSEKMSQKIISACWKTSTAYRAHSSLDVMTYGNYLVFKCIERHYKIIYELASIETDHKKNEAVLESQFRNLRKLLIDTMIPDIYSIKDVKNAHSLSYQTVYISMLERMFTALIQNIYFEQELSHSDKLSQVVDYINSLSYETIQREESNQDYYQHLEVH